MCGKQVGRVQRPILKIVYDYILQLLQKRKGSGCGTVGRAVAYIPEDPGSIPVIGNFYLNIYLLLTVCRKDENKRKKEAWNGPFFKKEKIYGVH